MAGKYQRDLRGRFTVSTSNVPDADAGKFATRTEIVLDNVSGAPSPSTIEHPHYALQADDLAQGGQRSPLRSRRPEMVSELDAAHTVYGVQGAVTRAAARVHGPMDPSAYLTGAEHING